MVVVWLTTFREIVQKFLSYSNMAFFNASHVSRIRTRSSSESLNSSLELRAIMKPGVVLMVWSSLLTAYAGLRLLIGSHKPAAVHRHFAPWLPT